MSSWLDYYGLEEKGGKYLEKENIFFSWGEEKQRRKRRKIFGEDLSKNCQGYWEDSISESLVSEKKYRFVFRKIRYQKKSFQFGKFGIGKKVSLSVSVKILVSSFSAEWLHCSLNCVDHNCIGSRDYLFFEALLSWRTYSKKFKDWRIWKRRILKVSFRFL